MPARTKPDMTTPPWTAASRERSRLCAIALAQLEPVPPPPTRRTSHRRASLLLLLGAVQLSSGALLVKPAIQPTKSKLPRSARVPIRKRQKPSMFDASPGPSAPAETRRLSPSLAATVGGRQLSPQGQPYWFDERIHSFGNGRFSAFFAPLATRIIDKFSYGGIDVRGLIHASLPKDASVVDLCCGVGYSTMPGATGVDTSKAFLGMGGLLRPDVTFCEGNAETWGEPFSHDVVTLMFATHEMPREARQRVLANAARIARRQVVVVDIDPEFKLALTRDPSRQTQARAFLDGEPYVMDYLAAIDDDVEACARSRGWQAATDRPIPGHVKRWTLTRATPSNGRAPAAQPQPASPWLYPTPRGESSGALDWGI